MEPEKAERFQQLVAIVLNKESEDCAHLRLVTADQVWTMIFSAMTMYCQMLVRP